MGLSDEDLFGGEHEFDPLALDDDIVDEEEIDDDDPYDIVDYPVVRNMPEHMRRQSVYTPETQGSIEAALLGLFDHNPARRPVLLAIIDLCRDGCPSSAIVARVEEMDKDNKTVYSPMTFCRMLERAGGLTLEEVVSADTAEDFEEGVEYLEIKGEVDPIWHATPEALEVYAQLTTGDEFRALVARDGNGIYRDVYKAVMRLVAEKPRKREEIEELVDGFEVVKHPRRFGGHFMDMLEKTDVIRWHNVRWTMTDLGRRLLAEIEGEE